MSDRSKEDFWGEGPGAAVLALLLIFGGMLGWAFAADWMEANSYALSWTAALGAYLLAGVVIGVLGGIALFFGSWWFAAQNYGAPGFLFGWLPGGVLAFVGGWLLVFLWGLPAVAGGAYLLLRR